MDNCRPRRRLCRSFRWFGHKPADPAIGFDRLWARVCVIHIRSTILPAIPLHIFTFYLLQFFAIHPTSYGCFWRWPYPNPIAKRRRELSVLGHLCLSCSRKQGHVGKHGIKDTHSDFAAANWSALRTKILAVLDAIEEVEEEGRKSADSTAFSVRTKDTEKGAFRSHSSATDADVALPFLADYKVKEFARIVVQKDIASQVVGQNIQKQPWATKKKMASKEKLSRAKMLKKLSWTVLDLNLPQLWMRETCLTQ